MKRTGRVACYVAIFAVACFGLFTRLGDRPLWADEAETALLARNVVQFGVPLADDGSNDLSRTRPGSKNADGVWIWSPWLDEYVVAGSFAAFGESTLSARLPFAVIALLTLALLARIAWIGSRSHEVVLVALTLGATNVAFLLHARQARYYALVCLAQLGVVYGMQRLMESATARAVFILALSLAAMFYCNYIVVPANAIGIAVAAWLLRQHSERVLHGAFTSLAVFALLALPWILYARPAGQAGALGVSNLVSYLVYYLGELHFHAASLLVFALPVLAGWLERLRDGFARLVPDAARRSWESDRARDLRTIVVVLIASQLVFLSFAPDRFFRYLTPLFPLAWLLASQILVRFVWPRPVRVVLVALLAATNVLSVGLMLPFPKRHRVDAPYATFARSISHDYSDRFAAVLDALAGELQPGDTVYVDDHELPLAFHTGARVLLARDARQIWQRPDVEHPDWVMPSPPSASLDPRQLGFRPGPEYERIEIEVPKSRRGGNRPHPDAHEFFTVEARETFVVYRKKARNSSATR